ncbi:MAG: phosphonate C-P lyase system protein PhnH [bacterium]|jgi:alpha-D-ribose 1-methylphosphonate 5-triphosphate synthase subunit PhnH|nr:phosphonate C-P lyase system protein PhnH [Rhodocyclaceae bacterium]MCE2981498.1 phosphonate C-P lyase system protein PhnH [Betaproteobacteria bacterium]
MNASLDLSGLGAGFEDASIGSQTVFRHCLDALSHPGKVIAVEPSIALSTPAGMHRPAAAILLALLDQDTRLWLSPALRGGSAGSFLRFHTGCTIVETPASADFGLVASGADLPSLSDFEAGSESYPDRSATLVVQCAALTAAGGWTLTGPGIRERARLSAEGIGSTFASQWAANRAGFPCGVDVFFASADALAALPRTTRLEG